jgi:hypothetical protein
MLLCLSYGNFVQLWYLKQSHIFSKDIKNKCQIFNTLTQEELSPFKW